MRNLARLSRGVENQIKHCLNGDWNCVVCAGRGNKNVRSEIAVESWGGYIPACKEHGEQAEKIGWNILRSLPQPPEAE